MRDYRINACLAKAPEQELMSAALSPPNETIQTMNAPQLQSNLHKHAIALPRARSEQGKDQSNLKKKKRYEICIQPSRRLEERKRLRFLLFISMAAI